MTPPGGWWCCCQDCWVFADDFDRIDSNSLGSDWVETETAAADIAISSYTMKMANGDAVCTHALPDPQGSFMLEFDTVNPQDEDRYEVHILWDGVNPSLKASFEVDATNSEWICGLWTGGASWYYDNVEMLTGCGTSQYSFLAGRTFNVSYDREIFRIGGETPSGIHHEFWKCATHPLSATTKIALVHGGGPNTLYWDNFAISDHYVHDRTCPFDGCVCGASE